MDLKLIYEKMVKVLGEKETKEFLEKINASIDKNPAAFKTKVAIAKNMI